MTDDDAALTPVAIRLAQAQGLIGTYARQTIGFFADRRIGHTMLEILRPAYDAEGRPLASPLRGEWLSWDIKDR